MFLKKAYFPPSLWDKVFEGKMDDAGAKRKREEKASGYQTRTTVTSDGTRIRGGDGRSRPGARRKKRLEEAGGDDDIEASDDDVSLPVPYGLKG